MSNTGRPQGPPCHHSILGACRCGASAGASGRACNYTTGLGCGQCHASLTPAALVPKQSRPLHWQVLLQTSRAPPTLPSFLRLHSVSAAGHVSLAWLVERLHADALLLPLAHAAASIDTWWTLGETLAYGKLEIQGRVRDGLVVDPAVKWIVVRMLARGRYVRYCDVRRAGDWDLLKASLRHTCQLPSWWFFFQGPGMLLTCCFAESRAATSKGVGTQSLLQTRAPHYSWSDNRDCRLCLFAPPKPIAVHCHPEKLLGPPACHSTASWYCACCPP